ncbi:MAG TPA: nitrile hydratase subunit alpha, partial [Kiloniellaceae bacterium]|nr:nitrile hydratase subunit alpha [Kiloniellaceae bacterium]
MAHDHAHPHPHQPDLEETPLTHYQAMTEAVGQLLIEKGVISGEELRAVLEQ